METLARAANRGSISTGYDIDNSLKLEADNSEELSRRKQLVQETEKLYCKYVGKKNRTFSCLQVIC
jgi:hypothetical protein